MLGPATYEKARLPWMSELPSTSRRRGTSAAYTGRYETWKRTLRLPIRNATTNMCGKVSASNAYATGIDPIRSARPRSVAIMIRRLRGRRSAQAPAWSAKSRFGASSAATRYPIWAALASRVRTATSGRAIRLTWSPSSETV